MRHPTPPHPTRRDRRDLTPRPHAVAHVVTPHADPRTLPLPPGALPPAPQVYILTKESFFDVARIRRLRSGCNG